MTYVAKNLFSRITRMPVRLSLVGVCIGLFVFVWIVDASSEFIVSTVSEFGAGTSTNVTITDAGGGNGDAALTLGIETSDQMQISSSSARVFDNAKWLAQTFTAGQNGFLTKIILSLDRNNSSNTDGEVMVEIRTTESGTPTSTVLTSAAMAAVLINKNGETDYHVSFTSPPSMASGTVYAIIVYRSGSGTITADYNWYSGGNSNQYANGGRYEINTGAAHPSWAIQNAGKGDLRFQTFYRAYPATGMLSSSVLDSATSTSRFLTLSWNETLFAGHDITFKARASPFLFNATDILPGWISLGSVNSSIDLSAFFAGSYRYFQWQATFFGTATTTPRLHDVNVSYNRPPLSQSQSIHTNEDALLVITLVGTDLDNDTLFFATSTSPAHGTLGIISGNQMTYTPAQNYVGMDFFDVRASDGTTESPAAAISITIDPVNDAPVVNSVLITPSVPKTNDVLTANINASDIEGDALTYTYQWKKNGADILGATSDTLDLAPRSAGDKGDVIAVEMVALDLSGGVSAPVISSGIIIANTAPAASHESIILNEDTNATSTFSAVDPDSGDILSYEIVTHPDPLLGSLGPISGNEVLYTAMADAHGADSFAYRASDGTDWGDSAAINVSINSVDDFVILDAVGNKIVNELVTLVFTAHATDVDADPETIVYSLVNQPSGAAIDSATGEFSWTPAEDQGPDDYTFEVHAASGGDIDEQSNDEEHITVTVHEVNEMPTVSNVSTSTLINASTTVSVNGQDSDMPANTLSFFIVNAPGHGTAGDFFDTDVNYVPALNYSGFDTFTFRAFDGSAYSTTATATIAVVAPPLAIPAAGTFTQAQSVTLASAGATEIRFTIDDTNPSCTTGTIYTHPISITETDTIRAVACFATFASSVHSFTYTIDWHISSDHIDDLWTNNIFTPVNGLSSSTTAVSVNQHAEINIQMGAGTSTVEIFSGTIITQTGSSTFSASDMNARIVAPDMVVVDSSNTLIASLEWGIPGITLEFSSPITIHIFVGTALNGETLHVRRSVSGTGIWTQEGIVDPATCLVAQGICTFSATKASFYAATTPASVPSSSSGSSSSGGSAASGSSNSGAAALGTSGGSGVSSALAVSVTATAAAQIILLPEIPDAVTEHSPVSEHSAVALNHIPAISPPFVQNQNTESHTKTNEIPPSRETAAIDQIQKTNEREQTSQDAQTPESRSLLAMVGSALTLGTGRIIVAIGVLSVIAGSVLALAWRFLL
ncbi:MAG: tandem-95 repeat protein [Candidatus Sungbacteria bacterium]|nr:tandem-95 repeat protein [bacterium]MDZ4260318.1 tandem-95 repeat protein [Candidatus Sungbacteria bacterium]